MTMTDCGGGDDNDDFVGTARVWLYIRPVHNNLVDSLIPGHRRSLGCKSG